MKREPLVSVIVTTKDEEENVEECLRSVMNQTFKNIELILVDNYSKDRTVEIAKKYADKVYLRGPERSSQRNFGAEISEGEYLLFLDADMILSPSLVEECLRKCEFEGFDALYIPERVVGNGFWIEVRDFERSFYTGTVIDAVRFVRKVVFRRINGFDENLVGPEDWDFDRRVREVAKTEIIDAPLYHNEENFDMRRYLEKKKYYAQWLNSYMEKWGADHSEIIRQLGVWYRSIGVFVENGKWRKLIRYPLLTVAMCYLRFRVGLAYFLTKLDVESKN